MMSGVLSVLGSMLTALLQLKAKTIFALQAEQCKYIIYNNSESIVSFTSTTLRYIEKNLLHTFTVYDRCLATSTWH